MYRIIYYILKGRLPVHIVIDTDDMRQHGTKQYRRSLETGGEELSKLEPKLILTKNKISAHIDLNSPRNNIYNYWNKKESVANYKCQKLEKELMVFLIIAVLSSCDGRS